MKERKAWRAVRKEGKTVFHTRGGAASLGAAGLADGGGGGCVRGGDRGGPVDRKGHVLGKAGEKRLKRY